MKHSKHHFKKVAAVLFIAAYLMVPAPAFAGSFPGDSGRIAFTTNRDGNDEIYSMNADGSDPRNLTKHPGNDRAASWSPDGTRIAFQSSRDGNNEIYVMNADGSDQKRLTANSLSDTQPSWSADGMKIAFVRTLEGGNKEIFTMRLDGSRQTNITNHPGPDTNPSWSPDNAKILFSSVRPQTGDISIYTMNSDGSGLDIYTEGAGQETAGSWAPDGKKILMKADLERSELYITGPGTYRQLTYDFNDEHIAPNGAWAPDGGKIVFDMAVDCNFELCPPNGGSTEVYTMDPYDTDTRRNITNRDDAADGEAVWQPLPDVTRVAIVTSTLPAAIRGEHYASTIQTTGGKDAKTFGVVGGSLPAGLALNKVNGEIIGTPQKAGNFQFALKVSDASGSDTKEFVLTVKEKVAPPPKPGPGDVNIWLELHNSQNNRIRILFTRFF